MRRHFDYKVDDGAIEALEKFKDTIKTSLVFMENDEAIALAMKLSQWRWQGA